MGKARGVRFTIEEEARIAEFLKNNPVLDFSTLARIAILDFLKKPRINLVPIRKSVGAGGNFVKRDN